MFRFLSGRKTRNPPHLKNSKSVPHKNLIQCKVILLDGTDLSVELSVCIVVHFKVQLVFAIMKFSGWVDIVHPATNVLITFYFVSYLKCFTKSCINTHILM